MLLSHNKPSEGRSGGLNLQLRHAWRQENGPTLLCSAFLGFVLVIPGQKYNYSEAKIICSQPAAPRAATVADSSQTGEQFVTVGPAHTPLSPFSHLCFWIHLCLFSLSPHVCFFGFGRFGVKVSISLVLSPTPPDDPGVVREAYLFPLFSKSHPASSRKCFRRGPACHIPSGSVENTPADYHSFNLLSKWAQTNHKQMFSTEGRCMTPESTRKRANLISALRTAFWVITEMDVSGFL